MNEHADAYRHFTNLLLTISAGTLALTAGLSSQRQAGPNWSDNAEFAFQMGWCFLAVSLLSGLALQWLIAMSFLDHANQLAAIEAPGTAPSPHTERGPPQVFRRKPQRRQKWYLHLQVGAFLAAVAALTQAILWR